MISLAAWTQLMNDANHVYLGEEVSLTTIEPDKRYKCVLRELERMAKIFDRLKTMPADAALPDVVPSQ
jgi:hypothetical protein